jgi:hypothetical protein
MPRRFIQTPRRRGQRRRAGLEIERPVEDAVSRLHDHAACRVERVKHCTDLTVTPGRPHVVLIGPGSNGDVARDAASLDVLMTGRILGANCRRLNFTRRWHLYAPWLRPDLAISYNR